MRYSEIRFVPVLPLLKKARLRNLIAQGFAGLLYAPVKQGQNRDKNEKRGWRLVCAKCKLRDECRKIAKRGLSSWISPLICRILTSRLPQSPQPARRSRQPWGCCPCRSNPSFPHGRARSWNRQTGRRCAYGPWYSGLSAPRKGTEHHKNLVHENIPTSDFLSTNSKFCGQGVDKRLG